MEQNIITIVSLIIIGIGILGTFLPVLPGLAVSFVGLILYKYGANPDFSIWYIVIFGILTLISLVLNYIIPIKTTEKKIVTESAVFFRLLTKVLAKKTRPKIILL